ncbi:hypothetical protein DFH09DRAFT_1156736 [Mycena vulgaris]|nr:hypothetical protein DFH09DRAFT_1156736 [Mycena vulgaris]
MRLTRLSTRFLQRCFHDTRCCRETRPFDPPRSVPTPDQQKLNAQLGSAVRWANEVLEQPRNPVAPTTTVSVQNLPPEAPLDEFLRLVLFGPLFRIDDKFRRHGIVSLSFFERSAAVAFYQEMTSNEVTWRDERLRFVWGSGRTGRWRPGPIPYHRVTTRAIYIHDVRQLGTREQFHEHITQYGPVDSVVFTNEEQSAFVTFLAAATAYRAAHALRKESLKVGFADDPCWTAGRTRADALRSHTRQVRLTNIPPGTTVSDLCDHIRGGALEKINFTPEHRTAFVHFIEHESAAVFYRHALYRGITLGGQRLRVSIKMDTPELTRLVPHVAASVAAGASRSVRTSVSFPADRLRHDFEHFGPVERVELTDGGAIVSFTEIQSAIQATRLITWHAEYQAADIDFVPDRCAAPFLAASRAAQTLQAHMASLLALQQR